MKHNGLTNKQVIQHWKQGIYGKSGNGNLRTFGDTLFSYQMIIGKTNSKGEKLALDVSGKNSYLNTTTRHVSLAKQVADKVIQPVRVKHGYGSWFVFPSPFEIVE